MNCLCLFVFYISFQFVLSFHCSVNYHHLHPSPVNTCVVWLCNPGSRRESVEACNSPIKKLIHGYWTNNSITPSNPQISFEKFIDKFDATLLPFIDHNSFCVAYREYRRHG